MLRIILIIIICLAIAGAFWMLYLNGFFHPVVVKRDKAGPFVLVYDEHTGPYSGIAKIQDRIYYALLNEDNITTYKGFGVYYSDPEKTKDENELKSIGGCILEESDYDKLEMLSGKYKTKRLTMEDALIVEMPFNGFLSVMNALARVYPKMRKHMEGLEQSKEFFAMDIYDIPNKKMVIIMPVKM